MFKLCSVILLRIVLSDGRILCQDKNASPWKPLGISCPVNCHNVRYAIERLRMFDYKNLLSKDLAIRKDLSSSKQIYRSIETQLGQAFNATQNWDDSNSKIRYANPIVNSERNMRKTINFKKKRSKYNLFKVLLQEFTELLHGNVLIDLQKVMDINITERKCSLLLKKAAVKHHFLKSYFNKCARRTNGETDFLNTLTDILNKYSKKVKFNLDMTKILLQKILGTSMDLRNGIFDIKKILKYLKMAIEKKEIVDDMAPLLTVTLKSTHCLSAYVAGCSCKRGYVELTGRCVQPADCTKDATLYKYIKRIIVY